RIAAYRDAAEAAQTAADTEAAIGDALANLDSDGSGFVDSADEDTNQDGTVDDGEGTAVSEAITNLDTNSDGVLDQTDVGNAQAAAETAQADADAKLTDAANKPVTDDVVDAVNHLLGIE